MNCTMICITAILIVAIICGTVMFKEYLQSRNLKRIIDVFDYDDIETLDSFKNFVEVIRSAGINLGKAMVGNEHDITRN